LEALGALVATRRAVNIIANQPTLLLSMDARGDVFRELTESIGRVEAALKTIESMDLRGGKSSND
jgi:hypothetical protein